MVVQTVLADDEVLARQKLRQMLSTESGIQVVGEAASALEVLDLVKATSPQLLFLDICMPGMDAFELIRELTATKEIVVPRIIFTTAYDSYALRAFEMNVVDYLLKPFTAERFRLAVTRAREEILAANRGNGKMEPAGNNGSRYTTRIVFKSRGRILFLPVSDIRWIGAEENYVRICTGSETHLLRQTLADLEEKLDPDMFTRVHRSAIVNLQYVKEVRTESRGEFAVVLVNGHKVAMSRSYRSRIGQMFFRGLAAS